MRVAQLTLASAAVIVLIAATAFASTRSGEKTVPQKEVTYAKDIAPILNRACVTCHRPAEVAPFSLIGYDNAKKWSGMVSKVTRAGQMPPWKAVKNYGEFLDENRLSEQEIAILEQWHAAGAPRGNPADAPEIPVFPATEWSKGEPDVILTPKAPFNLGAEGEDVYRNFVFKSTWDEPMWVKAMEVKPGNRTVVHHVIAYLDKMNMSSRLEASQGDGQEGYTSSGGGVGFLPTGALGGWAPGQTTRMAPTGMAFKVDPGESIVMQVHYHKTGKPEVDRTRLGLYLAKEPITKEMHLNWIFNFRINIPPGEASHLEKQVYTYQRPATIYGAMPHMHLLGRKMKSWLEFPDGTIKPLVQIDDWDFNWQLTYYLKDPIQVPGGTKQYVEAIYDNSSDNPRNPADPPRRVRFGEATNDEMFLLIVPYTLD